jgi:hypothetical protein
MNSLKVIDKLNINGLLCIGQVAVFYLPIQKLHSNQHGMGDKTPKELIHEFLMDNYNAYTLETSNTEGFWRHNRKSRVFQDTNARYEVSFLGKDKVPRFVGFLSEMCGIMGEEAIYLTMGRKSYLVLPKGKDNEI